MTALEARAAVTGAYTADVTLAVARSASRATASRLGFHVYAANPIKVALSAGRTTAGPRDIALVTRFAGPGLQRYLDHLDRTFELEAGRRPPRAQGRRSPRSSATSGAGASIARPPAPRSWRRCATSTVPS